MLNSQLKCRVYLGNQNDVVDYDSALYKFVGSMFNFIFLDEQINNTILDNRNLLEKVEILKKNGVGFESLSKKQKDIINTTTIDCAYSKMALKLFFEDKCFSKYMKACKDKDQVSLENYFKNDFVYEYSQYVDLLTEIFLKKLSVKPKKT